MTIGDGKALLRKPPQYSLSLSPYPRGLAVTLPLSLSPLRAYAYYVSCICINDTVQIIRYSLRQREIENAIRLMIEGPGEKPLKQQAHGCRHVGVGRRQHASTSASSQAHTIPYKQRTHTGREADKAYDRSKCAYWTWSWTRQWGAAEANRQRVDSGERPKRASLLLLGAFSRCMCTCVYSICFA